MKNEKPINIVAIDPGSTGAGIAFFKDGKLVSSEQFKFKPKDFYARLRIFKEKLQEFMKTTQNLGFVAVETQFIGFNPQSGLKVGQARGIALGVAFETDALIIDIAPQETRSYYGVKGNAKKEAYQSIIKLEHSNIKIGPDEADAIAIGYTAINKIKNARLYKSANK